MSEVTGQHQGGSDPEPLEEDATMSSSILERVDTCPPWCTAVHGTYTDDLDALHSADEVPLASSLTAQLCCSVDPLTGEVDGPFIVVGREEWSPQRTAEVGLALLRLAALADSGARADVSAPCGCAAAHEHR